MIEVVFGIPGSGKTTYLLNKIEHLVEEEYEPKDIAYITMTRNARAVARKRMANKFGATKDDLTYFRTLHSICWEMIGRPKKINQKMISDFFKAAKIEYEAKDDTKIGEMYEILNTKPTSLGGLYLNVYDQMRLKHGVDIEKMEWGEFNRIWVNACSGLVVDSQQLRASKNGMKAFKTLKKYWLYKKNKGVVDFPDMLFKANEQSHNVPTKVLIVDEFQDLCPLMYKIYENWIKGKEKVIIAGDDDQAIYSFMGACPDYLLTEKDSADNVITLEKSHRCPQSILNYASKTIERNEKRHKKCSYSNKPGGDIQEVYQSPINLQKNIRKDVDTLILARTNYHANTIAKQLSSVNIPFRLIDVPGIWSDKFVHIVNAVVKLTSGGNLDDLSILEFRTLIESLPSKGYLMRGVKKKLKESADMNRREAVGLLFHTLQTKKDFAAALKITKKQKELLSKWGLEPVGSVNIRIGTIHKAKGDEADDVFVQTLLPERTIKGMKNKDIAEEERRVRYVALTRARERVILLRSNEYNDIKDF